MRLDSIVPVPFHRFADKLCHRPVDMPSVLLEICVNLVGNINGYVFHMEIIWIFYIYLNVDSAIQTVATVGRASGVPMLCLVKAAL